MKINELANSQQQLDEWSMKDIQKGAKKIQKGAQKFQQNVAQTGDAVAGAANAVGGAGKELAKQTIARPVSAAYNAVKGAGAAAANTVANTYGDVKKGVQNVGQGISTAQTDLGNAAKFAGTTAANAVGGTAGAVGALAGGATTGVGRAAAHGFNTGVQAVGGDAVDQMQTNIMSPGAQKEIEKKQGQIQTLTKEIEELQNQAAAQSAAANPASTTGADAGARTAPATKSADLRFKDTTADAGTTAANMMRMAQGLGGTTQAAAPATNAATAAPATTNAATATPVAAAPTFTAANVTKPMVQAPSFAPQSAYKQPTYSTAQPKQAQAVAEGRVDFGAKLWTKMRVAK